MVAHPFTIAERTTAPAANEDVYTGIMVTDGDATSGNRVRVFSIDGAPATTNGWFGIDSATVRVNALIIGETPLLVENSVHPSDLHSLHLPRKIHDLHNP